MGSDKKPVKKQRWFFGGLSSGGAACFTHPLDTIKVVLQTSKRKESVLAATRRIIKQTGIVNNLNDSKHFRLRSFQVFWVCTRV